MSDFWKPIVGGAIIDSLNSQSNENSRIRGDLGYERTRRVMLENDLEHAKKQLEIAKIEAERAKLPTAEEQGKAERLRKAEARLGVLEAENKEFVETIERQQIEIAKRVVGMSALKEAMQNIGREFNLSGEKIISEVELSHKRILAKQSQFGNNPSDETLSFYHLDEIKRQQAEARAVEIEKGWQDTKRYLNAAFELFEDALHRRDDEAGIKSSDARWAKIDKIIDDDIEAERAKGLSGEPLYKVILNRYLGYLLIEGSPNDAEWENSVATGHPDWYRVKRLNDKLDELITKYNANPERGLLPYDKKLTFDEAVRISDDRQRASWKKPQNKVSA